MSKIRKPNSKFTIVPNGLLTDPNVSLKGKGLYALLVSKPEGWVYYENALLNECKESKDAYRSGIKELEGSGWIMKIQAHDKNGKFSANDFYLTDEKNVFPVGVLTVDGKTVNGKSVNVKSAPINTNDNNTDETILTNIPPIVPLDGFEEFWELWPKHDRKKDKKKCMAYWERNKLENDVAKIIEGLKHHLVSKQWHEENGKYIPMPYTWLNNERWEERPQKSISAMAKYLPDDFEVKF